jgi:hypothetical protein
VLLPRGRTDTALRDLLVLRLKRLFGRSSEAALEAENAALRRELRLLSREAKR